MGELRFIKIVAMSSADVRPYKSRLFNLISDNYQKVSDAGSRSWRYVKFAASLTVQTALYPFYVMLQTVRVTAKELGTAVKQHLPQLENSVNPPTPVSPHADTPIQRILKEATIESEAILQSESESEQPECCVQGIASLIETQKIVLVNRDNQILDVLTSSQHHRLQKQMILEVADYYRFQNRLFKQQQRFHSELYPLANQPQMLSPIRWFWQVMAWVQISPVAVKVNLFGESRLATALPQQQLNSGQGSFRSPQLFCSLDGTIAEFEENPIFPFVKPNQNLENQLEEEDSSLISSSDANFYKVQTLILAAVDYFFGQNNSQDLLNDAPEFLPPSSAYSVDDPWNTSAGQAEQNLSYKQRTEPIINEHSVPALPKGYAEETTGIWNRIKFSFRREKLAQIQLENSALSVPPEPKPSSVVKTVKPPLTIQPKSGNKTSKIVTAPVQKTAIATATPSPTASNSYPEAKPEWLEAKVTSTGYVKHPLERILGWLDQIMVGLEETVFKIWYWLTHYQK